VDLALSSSDLTVAAGLMLQVFSGARVTREEKLEPGLSLRPSGSRGSMAWPEALEVEVVALTMETKHQEPLEMDSAGDEPALDEPASVEGPLVKLPPLWKALWGMSTLMIIGVGGLLTAASVATLRWGHTCCIRSCGLICCIISVRGEEKNTC
jgi:hypothetical protein